MFQGLCWQGLVLLFLFLGNVCCGFISHNLALHFVVGTFEMWKVPVLLQLKVKITFTKPAFSIMSGKGSAPLLGNTDFTQEFVTAPIFSLYIFMAWFLLLKEITFWVLLSVITSVSKRTMKSLVQILSIIIAAVLCLHQKCHYQNTVNLVCSQ